jgi:hypothetical protein
VITGDYDDDVDIGADDYDVYTDDDVDKKPTTLL